MYTETLDIGVEQKTINKLGITAPVIKYKGESTCILEQYDAELPVDLDEALDIYGREKAYDNLLRQIKTDIKNKRRAQFTAPESKAGKKQHEFEAELKECKTDTERWNLAQKYYCK